MELHLGRKFGYMIRYMIIRKKLSFLHEYGYISEDHYYGVDFYGYSICIDAFWGPFYEPAGIYVRVQGLKRFSNNISIGEKRDIEVHRILPIREKLRLRNKSKFERFCILADYLRKNYYAIIEKLLDTNLYDTIILLSRYQKLLDEAAQIGKPNYFVNTNGVTIYYKNE
ncbi:MAG: hypothetical protein MJ103_00325 [Saccharofermentans sp.]|nr:hypothetical protein [Saccharofermentans sp.]